MMKKNIFLVVCLIVIIAATASLAGCGEEEIAEPLEELSAEESFIVSIIGSETNHAEFPEKIIDARIQGIALNIKLVGNDNLSSNFIKRGMLNESKDLLQEAFDEFPEIDLVYLEWQFPLTDTAGNVDLYKVLTIDLKRDTADGINWENFMAENFPAVADDFWQHAVFAE